MRAMNCRMEPTNGSVRPCFPNGSVYQTSGPCGLSTMFAFTSTTRSTPLNTAGGYEDVLVHAGAVRDEPAASACGRVGRGGGPDHDVRRTVARARELPRVPDRRQNRDVELGAVAAQDVIGELVQVVGERVLRV